MTLRVIDSGLNAADWNVAASAELAEQHRKGLIEDTLRIHRYERCVLLGINQDAEKAVDVAACKARGVPVVHRATGGGAVYMSPGVFVWEIVADRRRFGSLEQASAQANGAVAAALRSVGVAAQFSPPNSIMVAGRKIGGAAGVHDGGTLLSHGTVLGDVDIEELAACLRVDPSAVTTLGDLLPAVPDIGAALTEAFISLWEQAAAA